MPGGGWMTLWGPDPLEDDTRLFVRTLSAQAELGPPRFLGAAGRRYVDARIAFSGRTGVVLIARRGACHDYEALPIDRRGRARGRRTRLVRVSRACADRTSFGHTSLVGGGRGRFLLGFSTFNRDAGHYVRAAGLRAR